MTWWRKRWIWMRLDTALFFIPEDLREVTLETWYEHSKWQERENEQAQWRWEMERRKEREQ